MIELDAEGQRGQFLGRYQGPAERRTRLLFRLRRKYWLGGNPDAIAQKYSRDGKLLLQIGTKKKFDSADGTEEALR